MLSKLADLSKLTLLCIRNPGLGGTVGRFLCWSFLSGGSGIRPSSSGVSRPNREGWELCYSTVANDYNQHYFLPGNRGWNS